MSAVRRAVTLPPAEAMRPPAPPVFRKSRSFDRLTAWLDQPTRILLRQVGRYRVRSLLTSFAVATSVGLLVMAMQWIDDPDSGDAVGRRKRQPNARLIPRRGLNVHIERSDYLLRILWHWLAVAKYVCMPIRWLHLQKLILD